MDKNLLFVESFVDLKIGNKKRNKNLYFSAKSRLRNELPTSKMNAQIGMQMRLESRRNDLRALIDRSVGMRLAHFVRLKCKGV